MSEDSISSVPAAVPDWVTVRNRSSRDLGKQGDFDNFLNDDLGKMSAVLRVKRQTVEVDGLPFPAIVNRRFDLDSLRSFSP